MFSISITATGKMKSKKTSFQRSSNELMKSIESPDPNPNPNPDVNANFNNKGKKKKETE